MAAEKDRGDAEVEFQERLRDFAHEIGTPLNAMIGYSHMIKRELEGGTDAAKISDYNQIIEASTVRLLRICERVLDDAVSEEPVMKIEDVDIGDLADGVLDTFNELAAKRGIVIKVEFPDDFPMVPTDSVLVEQVLTNLVSNAIKFTSRGGTITLKGELDEMNNAAILIVRDTGKGIPAGLMLKIRKGEFVSTPGQRGEEGWGRGLQIAQKICGAVPDNPVSGLSWASCARAVSVITNKTV